MSTTFDVWTVAGCSTRCLRVHAAGSGTSISKKRARNDWQSVQILARAAGGSIAGFDIATTALTGPGGAVIDASNITVYRAHQIEVVQETWRNSGDNPGSGILGWIPDALIPTVHPVTRVAIAPGATYQALPYTLPADETHTFLADIFVPKTTTAGNYTGTITVSAVGQDDVEISISLTVWKWALPDTPALKSDFAGPMAYIYRNRALFGWTTEEQWDDVRGWDDVRAVCNTILANHGIAAMEKASVGITDSYFRPEDSGGGAWEYPAAEVEPLQTHIDAYHPSSYRINAGCTMSVYDVSPYDADEYAVYVAAMVEGLSAVDRPDTEFHVYVADEPFYAVKAGCGNDSTEVNRWGPAIVAESSIKSLVTGYPELLSITYHPILDHASMIGSIDTWVLSLTFYEELQQAAVQARIAAGDSFWFYTATSGDAYSHRRPYWALDRALLNYRLLPWICWHENATGMLYWSSVLVDRILRAGLDYWTEPASFAAAAASGTVTATKDSKDILGDGNTKFLTELDRYCPIADDDGDFHICRIDTITDDHNLTITTDWTDNTAGGLTFYKRVYNGEGLLAYPCSKAEIGYYGAIQTMRLKALREGVIDFGYLQLAKAYGLGAEANTKVNALITSIGAYGRGGGDGSWGWEHDPDAYDAARESLGDRLNAVWPADQPPARLFPQEPTFERREITGSVADYVGRTTDVLAYHGAVARGEVLLDQTLAQPAESGRVCTGIQKLAQRFLLELLTEKGTMTYLPTRGTDFMYEARIGRFRTRSDIYGAMSRALVNVKRNLQAEESDADPDDERYKIAEILQVVYTPGEAKIWIRVFSQDDNAIGILPISVTL